MMKTYYRKAKGSLLVYDVTSRSSFMGLEVREKQKKAVAGGGGWMNVLRCWHRGCWFVCCVRFIC